jgi:hypothetical protein
MCVIRAKSCEKNPNVIAIGAGVWYNQDANTINENRKGIHHGKKSN